MPTQKTTRISLHISQKQRNLFEQAVEIGGYKSLNAFVVAATSEKAEGIIFMQKHNAWLSSENDRKLFFNALLNPSAPNAKLRQAMKRHQESQL
jgi:uncharacterized protein (DUF1778 family)